MIIPSIDVQGGQVVQLIGGQEKALDAGAPADKLPEFAVAGEVAVVDLDAAMGTGDNADLLRPLLPHADIRIGGGIRSVESALSWLDAGASKVVLGTAARPDVLRELPRDRVVAALDAVHGEVVVEGWRTKTGRSIAERMVELRELVGGFLVTFVEREGRMQGTALDEAKALLAHAGDARLTIAGGVTTAEEIAELDRLGIDAQVGMALYTGQLDLGDAVAAPLKSDRPDGLFATVIVDEHQRALGLAWSSPESIREAIRRRRGVYHSRRRGLWEKGETSGHTQELLRVDLDCDRDALRFTVRQRGAPPSFCHEGTRTCWGPDGGLPGLDRTVAARKHTAPAGSRTKRLFEDPALLRGKLLEEAGELAEASSPQRAVEEAADLLYFALVCLRSKGGTLADVEAELDRRARSVRRRQPSPPKGSGAS